MNERGDMVSLLGSVKVLSCKYDVRGHRVARVKRTTVTAVERAPMDGGPNQSKLSKSLAEHLNRKRGARNRRAMMCPATQGWTSPALQYAMMEQSNLLSSLWTCTDRLNLYNNSVAES